jgi:KDO2-lipid IV(A) lauroyltransferase
VSRKAPTLMHRIEYALYSGAAAVGKALPQSLADRAGAAIGRLGYRPLGIRRQVTEEQLRAAFPEKDDAWVRATALASYAHIGREGLAMLRMASFTAAEIVRNTREENDISPFMRAVEAGKGVVVVSGHFGNWEVAAAGVVARGVPFDVVVQRQSNPLFDAAMARDRERFGMRIIERSRAPREALSALRAGRAVAFVSDQDARGTGVFVPFFGRLASTHRGPALLALRTGAPLFVGYAMRASDGGYVGGLEEITASREGDMDEAVLRLTAAFTARLEALIRRAPEQYFWQHRRWKTRPPRETQEGVNKL